jgi:hypothetical protein
MNRAARSPFQLWLVAAALLVLAASVLTTPSTVAFAAPAAEDDCRRADQPAMPVPGTPGASGF